MRIASQVIGMNKTILFSLKENETHINPNFLRPLPFFKCQALIKQLKTVLIWDGGVCSLFVEERMLKICLNF